MAFPEDYIELTVLSGQTNGTVVNTKALNRAGRMAAVGFLCPAAVDGTEVTIEGSEDGTTFTPIRDIDGTIKSKVTISAGSRHFLDPVPFSRIPPHLRVVNGTQATADRTYKLFIREV